MGSQRQDANMAAAAPPPPLLQQPSDRFALRWNDFPDNVTAIFRQLRRDGQLADVTLMCAGGRQVRAHKVVLSSSSSFFRQFLRDHSQPNPWLFLRGVEAKLLDWLMDFIYLGEVMVTQESFPSFLALARDLGVRGLTGATPAIGKKQEKQQQQEEPTAAAPSNNFPSSGYTTQSGFSSQSGYASQSGYTDVAKDGTVEYLADVVKTEPQEEENARLPDFDLLEDSYDGALVIAEDEDINTLTKEEKVKLRVQQRLLNAERRLMPNATEIDLAEQSEVNAELDRRISDMIVRQDGGWVCTVCGKQANHKSKLKQHAETHLQGYSHPCIMCGKTYRSRNVLRMHMSRDHRSKGHMDQMARAEDTKHYLKMEPIQHHQRILLPQPHQQTPAIQYHHESSPILKATTIKQMVQQTMKQEQQHQNHIVIDGEQQHEQIQDYKQHQDEEEEEEEEEEAGQAEEVLEILGADEEDEEEMEQQQT